MKMHLKVPQETKFLGLLKWLFFSRRILWHGLSS